MGVLQVARISPQSIAAVQMSLANAGQILELLAEVGNQDTPGIIYGTQSQTGPPFADRGGWRITFSRADHPDQFAYPGDWILVTDATYATGWALAATSEVFVYGISTGLAGTADDFNNTFAPVTG